MRRGQEILEETRALIDDPRYARFAEIDRAYQRLCRVTNFNWLRETSTSMLTFRANVSTYYIKDPEIRRIDRIWVKDIDDEQSWLLMEERPPRLYETDVKNNRNSDGTDDTDRPDFYMISGWSPFKIEVTPTPDNTYTARVDYTFFEHGISMDSEPRSPPAYDNTIALQAAVYILERSADQNRVRLAAQYAARVESDIQELLRDSHPNRTATLDRTPIAWMR